MVEAAIAAHKGHIFSSAGDGLVAEFPSIVEAIRCAVEIQNEIATRNASVPENERMQFRIGVNLGDVIVEDNNLYGSGVNVAVRLEQLAEPGGICISQTVYDQVRKIVEIPFEDMGERRLKNIAEPVHVYRILPAPLPWFNRLLSRSNIHLRRSRIAPLIFFLLIFAVAVGASYYLRQPATLWSRLLSDFPKGAAIAVLPFVSMGDDPAQKSFSSGLTDDIMTELSRWRDRRVVEYQGKAVDVRDIGRELGVRYVLTGTVKPIGNDVSRINPTLKDAQTGATIWSEQFDRNIIAKNSLVDDETACRIVAKIAGGYGVIERTEAKSAKRKSPEELEPHELVVKARAMMQWEWIPDNFAKARELLRRAIELDPNSGPARRERAWYALMGSVFGVDERPKSPQPDALDAVKLEPDDGRARMVAASTYFFANELKQFKDAAKQAIADAPCDPENLAILGALLGNAGEWKRGVELVEKANTLNSAAAQAWYHSTIYLNHYLNGDYQLALDKIKESPDFLAGATYAYYDYIAICGQLGLKQQAFEKWRNILEVEPTGASAESIEKWYRMWNFGDEDIAKLMDGVYKSGVLEAEAKAQPVAQDHRTEPGVER